jgi:hypothetical protein
VKEKMEMRAWQELGVVDTIYEDDQKENEDCYNSIFVSSSAVGSPNNRSDLSPPTILRGIVEAWYV